MKLRQPVYSLIGLLLALGMGESAAAPASGTRLSFRVLSARAEVAPPFTAVDFVYGPKEPTGLSGRGAPRLGQWWQLEIRTNTEAGTAPLCLVRGLTSADPLAGQGKLQFARYQLRIPETGEAFEYVDVHTGAALLPSWVNFEKHFVPSPAAASHRQDGAPETCELLGHVLSLQHVGHHEAWIWWSDAKRLALDREMLVGTGRNFKDVEGRRLPQTAQSRDYTYTNFCAADYHTMFEVGMNLFTIAPEQEQWVRAEPVFYLRTPAGTPPLRYPADLYRANYLGAGMFIDEPASVLTWDKYAAGVLTHFSDAAALIEQRTRATVESECPYYSQFWLERLLTGQG